MSDAIKDLTAQAVPYSSVVGSSVMVLRNDGPCVGMVLIRGMTEPMPKETQEALAELIATAITQPLSAENADLRRQLDEARDRALEEAAEVVKPLRDEPSVDSSNPGDVEEHAAWLADSASYRAILALRTTTGANDDQ